MATKSVERMKKDSTWNKVGEDEPIFILRASDKTAIHIVNMWINISEALGVNKNKISEAIDARNSMTVWQHVNHEKMKLPD